MTYDFPAILTRFLQGEGLRRAAIIESDLAEAITLQDYGKLERLVIISAPDVPDAVASLIEP